MQDKFRIKSFLTFDYDFFKLNQQDFLPLRTSYSVPFGKDLT